MLYKKLAVFTRKMDKVIDIVGGVMFFLMVLFTGFNVFSFWTTGRRYGQTEELVVSCLVWVSYLCLGQHYRKNECVQADFLIQAMPESKRKIFIVIRDVASFIIGAFVLYFGIRLMMRSTNKFTGVLKICYVWIDLGLVLGFISLIWNIILKYLPHAKEDEEALL